jgi:hypothetical protein
MVFEALENLQNRPLDNNQQKGAKDGTRSLGKSGFAAVLGCSAIVAGVTLAMSNSVELQSQPLSISAGLVLSGLGILIIRWYRL